jgi:O-antigen/teichoic acid export membrane protein
MFANIAHLFSGQVVTVFSRLFYILVIARYLGPELYGLLVYSQAWYLLFLPGVHLGLGSILSREVGKSASKGKLIAREVFTIRIIALSLLTTACGAIGIYSNDDVMTKVLILLMCFALIGRSISIHCLHVFTAFEQSRYSARLDIGFRISEVIVAIIVVLLFKSVYLVAFTHACFWLLQAAAGLYLLRSKLKLSGLSWQWKKFALLLYAAAPIAISDFITGAMLQFPLLLIKGVADSTASVGNMALLIQGVAVLLTVSYAIGGASLPVLSRAANVDDAKINRFISVVFRATILCTTLFIIVAVYPAQLLIVTLFGEGYELTARHSAFIFYMVAPMTLFIIYRSVLLAYGYIRLLLALNIIVGVLLLAFSLQTSIPLSFTNILSVMTFAYCFLVGSILVLFTRKNLVSFIKTVMPVSVLSCLSVTANIYFGEGDILTIFLLTLVVAIAAYFLIVKKSEKTIINGLIIKIITR